MVVFCDDGKQPGPQSNISEGVANTMDAGSVILLLLTILGYPLVGKCGRLQLDTTGSKSERSLPL
jgi:hypothetical protein